MPHKSVAFSSLKCSTDYNSQRGGGERRERRMERGGRREKKREDTWEGR